jgi:hypothetical protein
VPVNRFVTVKSAGTEKRPVEIPLYAGFNNVLHLINPSKPEKERQREVSGEVRSERH